MTRFVAIASLWPTTRQEQIRSHDCFGVLVAARKGSRRCSSSSGGGGGGGGGGGERAAKGLYLYLVVVLYSILKIDGRR